jgi:uncharacterized alpha-E superfamily protein
MECLSVEALGTINNLEAAFSRAKFRPRRDEAALTLATQRLCDVATAGIAEFFGVAEATMLADRGWNFCRLGQQFERASITCNAGSTIFGSIAKRLEKSSDIPDHAVEIELSAFLRMLASRDIYRRVYQMRAEPVPVLNLLYNNEDAPKSVHRCLRECALLLGDKHDDSPGARKTRDALERILELITATDWTSCLKASSSTRNEAGGGIQMDPARAAWLVESLDGIMSGTHAIHDMITDGFINHQILLD